MSDKCVWKRYGYYMNPQSTFVIKHFDEEIWIPLDRHIIKHLNYCMKCGKTIEIQEAG